MAASMSHDCPWCGQVGGSKRQVAPEEIPHLIAQLLHELLAIDPMAGDRVLAGASVHSGHPGPAAGRTQNIPGIRRRTVPLGEVERDHIVTVLRHVGGNRMAAARILGISRRALYRRLDRYRIVNEVPRAAGGRGV